MRQKILLLGLSLLLIALPEFSGAGSAPASFTRIAPELGRNFLDNGDFEKDSDHDGLPDEWGHAEDSNNNPPEIVGRNIRLERFAEESGNQVLKIKIAADGRYCVNYFLRERQRYVYFDRPVVMLQSLKVKNKGRGVVKGSWINPDFSYGSATPEAGPSEEWRTISVISKFDPAVHGGIAMVRININGAKAGDEYLIDDYEMKAALPEKVSELEDEMGRKIVLEPGKNFLLNGDFEKDDNHDGLPDRWDDVRHGLPNDWDTRHVNEHLRRMDTKTSVRRLRAADGNHFLSIKFLSGGDCAVNYNLKKDRGYFTSEKPVDLFFSVKVKNRGKGVIYARWLDIKDRVGGCTPKTRTGNDWEKTFAVSRFSPDANVSISTVQIYICDATAGDEYFVDEIGMEAFPAGEYRAWEEKTGAKILWDSISAEEADKTKDVCKGNRLMDSSFETNPLVCPVHCGSKWWASGSVQKPNNAFHGEYTMKGYQGPPGPENIGRFQSDPINYRAGVPHTISFYARGAEGEKVTVTLSPSINPGGRWADPEQTIPLHQTEICLTDKPGGSISKPFSVTSEWRRYHFSFIPGKDRSDQKMILRFDGSQECKVEFDAVQLEEGGLTDYSMQDIEMAVLLPRDNLKNNITLYYEDEEPAAVLSVVKKGPAEINADLVVNDFWMNEVYRKRFVFNVPENKPADYRYVRLPRLKKGAYRFHLENKQLKSRSMIYGVISRELGRGSEICGGCHATGLDSNRALSQMLGLTWSRDHSLYWSEHVAEKGGFKSSFTEENELRQKLNNSRLRFWSSLGHPPPPLSEDKISEKWTRADGPEPPEEFLSGMERFVSFAVRHYQGRVRYFECWNEPYHYFTPDNYYKVLQRFYKAVKSTDKDAVVVGFSGFIMPENGSYTTELLKMGAVKYCDIMSYHGYIPYWADDEDRYDGFVSLADSLDFTRNKMRETAGAVKPIWNNEFIIWGKSWYEDERIKASPPVPYLRTFNYREGVSMIVHYITIAYAHGVSHFGPHMFDQIQVIQEQMSIGYIPQACDYDFSIKPKSIAYAVVCGKLNGATLVKEEKKGDLFISVFDKPAGSLAVIFTRHAKPVSITLPEGKNLLVKDVFDADMKMKQPLQLPGEPIYIEYSGTGKDLADILGKMKVAWPAPSGTTGGI